MEDGIFSKMFSEKYWDWHNICDVYPEDNEYIQENDRYAMAGVACQGPYPYLCNKNGHGKANR
eukprot:UN17562